MNGIIVVNKPKGPTSRDIVNKICKILGTKQVGHTGTLDPLASGILIICVGRYTKLVDYIKAETKKYVATVRIGLLTDTLDITGNVISDEKFFVSKSELENAVNNFSGLKYLQEVPIYSAVKVNGMKLYEYARNNIPVVLPKKDVNIYSCNLDSYDEKNSFVFTSLVSKGTYIRALIYDICKILKINGTMSDLKRIQQGDITLDCAYNLSDIESGNFKFLKVSDVLGFEKIFLNESEFFKVMNGVKMNFLIVDGNYLLMYGDIEVAIYEFIDSVGSMRVKLYLKGV